MIVFQEAFAFEKRRKNGEKLLFSRFGTYLAFFGQPALAGVVLADHSIGRMGRLSEGNNNG